MNKKCYAVIAITLLACGLQVNGDLPPVLAAPAFAAYSPETSVTLKEYVDLRFVKFNEYVNMRFSLMNQARDEIRESKLLALSAVWDAKHIALEKQIEIAKVGMEGRLTLMNEFRESLKDQNGKFVLREAYEVAQAAQNVEIASLKETRARVEGMATQQSVFVSMGMSGLAILLGAAGVILSWFEWPSKKRSRED